MPLRKTEWLCPVDPTARACRAASRLTGGRPGEAEPGPRPARLPQVVAQPARERRRVGEQPVQAGAGGGGRGQPAEGGDAVDVGADGDRQRLGQDGVEGAGAGRGDALDRVEGRVAQGPAAAQRVLDLVQGVAGDQAGAVEQGIEPVADAHPRGRAGLALLQGGQRLAQERRAGADVVAHGVLRLPGRVSRAAPSAASSRASASCTRVPTSSTSSRPPAPGPGGTVRGVMGCFAPTDRSCPDDRSVTTASQKPIADRE